jgi:hypothetical protein
MSGGESFHGVKNNLLEVVENISKRVRGTADPSAALRSGRDDKGGAALSFRFDIADDEQQVAPLGQDDTSFSARNRQLKGTNVFSKCRFEDALSNRLRV